MRLLILNIGNYPIVISKSALIAITVAKIQSMLSDLSSFYCSLNFTKLFHSNIYNVLFWPSDFQDFYRKASLLKTVLRPFQTVTSKLLIMLKTLESGEIKPWSNAPYYGVRSRFFGITKFFVRRNNARR